MHIHIYIYTYMYRFLHILVYYDDTEAYMSMHYFCNTHIAKVLRATFFLFTWFRNSCLWPASPTVDVEHIITLELGNSRLIFGMGIAFISNLLHKTYACLYYCVCIRICVGSYGTCICIYIYMHVYMWLYLFLGVRLFKWPQQARQDL